MEFNDGSQYRVLTNLDAYVGAGRDTYMFRASSATNGVPYTDTQFGHHRSIAAPLRAVIMYQFPWENAGTPESQADYLCNILGGGLCTNEMVMLDMEAASKIVNPVDFARRWLARVESRLQTLAWLYVPSSLAGPLGRGFTGPRIVMAPRYPPNTTIPRGDPPGWSHDVWQYTDRGFFPGCAQTGDTSTTSLTATEMLIRCNPTGIATLCGA
jgi:hypothetical protein